MEAQGPEPAAPLGLGCLDLSPDPLSARQLLLTAARAAPKGHQVGLLAHGTPSANELRRSASASGSSVARNTRVDASPRAMSVRRNR